MGREKGTRGWIIDYLVRPLYEETKRKQGSVDKVKIAEQALEQLENVPDMDDEFTEIARWRAMREYVNGVHTEGSNRQNAGASPRAELQSALPGLEDVRRDRFTIEVDGEEKALDTWEASIEELVAKIEAIDRDIRGREASLEFYIKLRDALRVSGKRTVKELYEDGGSLFG